MQSVIEVRCLYFASLKDAAGTGSEVIPLQVPATVQSLLAQIETLHPHLEKYRGRYKVAVQQEMAELTQALHAGDEVALIPPVSGGSPADSVRLQAAALDAEEALRHVSRKDCGAVVLFLGTVRDFAQSEGSPEVQLIDYSAYESMAEKDMHGLVREVREITPTLGGVALWHRTGHVQAGEASVAVAVSSRHRSEAFTASRWLIDELKARVPIWKKEIGPTGEVWLEGDARVPSGGGKHEGGGAAPLSSKDYAGDLS